MGCFSVEVNSNKDLARIKIKGELDISTIGKVWEAAAKIASLQPVQVDMSDVTYIDCSGIRWLLSERNKRNGHLTLMPSKIVARVINILNLDALFAASTNGY